jgi:hypothetical protein
MLHLTPRDHNIVFSRYKCTKCNVGSNTRELDSLISVEALAECDNFVFLALFRQFWSLCEGLEASVMCDCRTEGNVKGQTAFKKEI